MKTFLAKILFFIILFNNSFLNAEIKIQAKTAIIQDYLSGKILYEKDPDIKNFSSNEISPFFSKSNATIEVMIFVIEAGYMPISASFSYRILPDKKSCRITVLASIFISAFNNELLNKIKKNNIFMEKFFIYLYLLHLDFQNLVYLNSNKFLS